MSHAKRYSTREVVPSRRFTRDSRLSAARQPINPGLLGAVWAGDLQPVGLAVRQVLDQLAQLKGTVQRDAVMAAVSELQSFGGPVGASQGAIGNYASLVFGGSAIGRPEKIFGAVATPDDVQEANDAYYSSTASRAVAHDAPRTVVGTPTAINEANASFWASHRPARYGREFGKG